ncbi:MAG: diacylglycerol kinase family lipid kinase [Chitinophagales bacterium]|nr:diacylglycerol kinase family lipid kinase [Chitinophagales bacterium]
MKKKVRFIINPKSGSFFQKRFSKRFIKEYLDLEKFEYDIFYTKYAGHAIRIAQQSIIDKIDIIAVVGGDGTQNEVGQIIMDTPILLASIPMGSGNANARKLKIPLDIKDSLRLINDGIPYKIDALFLNGQAFFMAAGIGFDATAAKEFAKVPFRGVIAYLYGVLKTAFTYQPGNYSIEIDGKKTICTKAYTVLVTSTGELGFDVAITKKSIPNDGQFELVIVKDFNKLKIPFLIYEAFYGDIVNQEMIEIHPVNECVKIKSERWENIQMDGDFRGKSNEIEVVCKKQALRFLVNKNFYANGHS